MCSYVKAVDRAAWLNFPGAVSHPIFDAQHTPIQGTSAMLNFFVSDTYPAPGVHEDNEGFYVISGEGKMMIGQEEYELSAGCAMLVPAGVPHAIKKVHAEHLQVFIYHFPKREE